MVTLRRSTRKRTPVIREEIDPAPTPKPAATRRNAKRKAAAPPAAKKAKNTKKAKASQPKKKTKLSNLQARTTATANLSLKDVVVDPQADLGGDNVEIHVCVTPIDDANNANSNEDVPTDAMLALVDPAKNSDKFYIVQLVEKKNQGEDEVVSYHLYTRWGRTGTKGQAQIEDFESDDWDSAYAAFCKTFKTKSGLQWADRQQAASKRKTHYHFVGHNMFRLEEHYVSAADAASANNPKWQYWVDDGVDGKADGWYPYDADGGAQVERLFQEYQNLVAKTQHDGNDDEAGYVALRIVASGIYNYAVDLVNMTQTNVTHANHTRRFIRRFTGGDDNGPPTTTAQKVAPPAPVSSSSSAAAVAAKTATPTTTKAAAKKTKTASPPVDDLISIIGRRPSDYSVVKNEELDLWYDVVLNQCNIAGNNNKYYRLQMMQHNSTKMYYVWFRWGRVGEMPRPSTSTWNGPYASEEGAAFKTFTKKYHDKTKNAFGAEDFKPKKGKYVPVEVDHNVEVDNDALDAADAANAKTAEIEYLPSKLDKTTKDLIQTLFSKEMRNEALSEFKIDLKRLPLGVPSQAQIQSGIEILQQIEDKLADTSSVRDSFTTLSSHFYTTIPHSFGRSRPPVISDKESLQSRFDMCNILMDMYSTSETVRKLEAEEKKAAATKTTLPNPVDSHYDSLKADLSLLDKMSKDFQTINQYFEVTKGSHSSAKLLNVWSVNRQNEEERFQEHDSLANRFLLWHGTNIAVVAPILTSGLRIMPHSGGRVGAGIYLANLQQKSAQYTSGYGAKYACMFLCEAPLGKQHTVDSDGYHASSLKAAPKGFDSVHAVGRTQPTKFATLNLDGKVVKVPSAAPGGGRSSSSFWHDELLVYKESQVRLRYVITVKL